MKSDNNEFHRLVILIVVHAISVFLQCVLFHYQAFHTILVSSIINNPIAFWAFYLPKISIAMCLSVFVILIKNKWWLMLPCSILFLWSFAELIYFRANAIFLDAYSFTMINNMSGYWNSLLTLIRASDILLLVPPFMLIVALCFFNTSFTVFKLHRICAWASVLGIISLSIIVHVMGALLLDKQLLAWNCTDVSGKTSRCFNPFTDIGNIAFWGFTNVVYISQTSVAHAFINTLVDFVQMPFEAKKYEMNESDIEMANVLFNKRTYAECIPQTRLYIILVESFENWAISEYTTPNMMNFINKHENVLWCKNIKKQTRGGTSGDGQMIVNTGVLPIDEGATCFRYPGNTYPSLSELFDSSCLIMPGDLGCWNQKRMSDAYRIDQNINSVNNDGDSFKLLDSIYHQYDYALVVTTASHTPFKQYKDRTTLSFNANMPTVMSDYLHCIHYTDSCMCEFLSMVDTDSIISNSTIVITGDHTIFDQESRTKFSNYCTSFEEQYSVSQNSCPLIIYSPFIQDKKIIEDQSYQMDIFPTIMKLIGCDNMYYWRGFGKDLLNPNVTRPYSEDEAFQLSDRLIRSNYFNSYEVLR